MLLTMMPFHCRKKALSIFALPYRSRSSACHGGSAGIDIGRGDEEEDAESVGSRPSSSLACQEYRKSHRPARRNPGDRDMAGLKQAIQCYLYREGRRGSVDDGAYIHLLRRCGDAAAAAEGRLVHAHIVRGGRGGNVVLANMLVRMYGGLGCVNTAFSVFDNLGVRRDAFSWNIMLAVYVRNKHVLSALSLVARMRCDGVKLDAFAGSTLLSACACLGDLAQGECFHALVIAAGLDSDVVVGNALLSMYAKCNAPVRARAVFEHMPQHDTVSWNTIIGSCRWHAGHARELYHRMQLAGDVAENHITRLAVINVCADIDYLKSVATNDIAAMNALTHMYSKRSNLTAARRVFDEIPLPNTISFNIIIAAYSNNNHGDHALALFHSMVLYGVKPDTITFLHAANACTTPKHLQAGRLIHAYIVTSEENLDLMLDTALINMYGKCGSPNNAFIIFCQMRQRNVITWNAMIAAYTWNAQGELAYRLFEMMDLEGIAADMITFLTLVDACADQASLENGRKLHQRIIQSADGICSCVTIENALVSMYGMCGSVDEAAHVFHQMHNRNVISWNTMITVYAQSGDVTKALELLQLMNSEGVRPDDITFLGILSACNHAGLIDEAQRCLVSMKRDSDIVPLMKHYASVIDLLGRARHLKEANELINNMPIHADATLLSPMLGVLEPS